SNDSAAAAMCTTALWAVMRAISQPTLRPGNTVLSGLSIGAALLSKTSAVLLIPLCALILLVTLWKQRRRPDEIAILLALWAASMLVVAGWWYGRNWILYSDPMGFSSHTNTPWGREHPATLLQLLLEIPLLVRSFWGAYGWGHILWPDTVYLALTVIGGLVLLSTLHDIPQALKIMRFAGKPPPDIKNLSYTKSMALLAAWGWLALVAGALLNWMRQVQAPHGRLLFPAIAAWGILITYGLQIITQRFSKGRKVTRWILGLLASLSILAPGARIVPSFAKPRLVNAVKIEEPDFSLTYEGMARVYDIRITEGYSSPGDTIKVHACWESLQQMPLNYTVFVHLLGPENTRAAERHTYPGLGRYPTTLWRPGTAFCEEYTLQVEPWAPTPVLYQVEIGLYDAETGARLPAMNANARRHDPPIVGVVPVIAQTEPQPSGMPMQVSFDDQILLTGVDFPPTAAPGQSIDVTLHWQARTVPEQQLVVFVHLWQENTAQPLAQDDSMPNRGWFPTDVWQKGVRIPDVHTLRLPESLAAGRYMLWTGIYRSTDSTRLRAVGADGSFSHNLVPIGQIVIE
ncbi:MAG: hypothetical protein P1S60_14510, partial [Anaerolineae bacterium]|nr:hypothetical protein [Anaerolineae bacterium]